MSRFEQITPAVVFRRARRDTTIFIAAIVCLFGLPGAGLAQTGENVLVVVNGAVAESVRIGEAYAAARAVPADQVVWLEETPAEESVSRTVYVETIEEPIRKWIAGHALHDRILYIVLTKGIPIRVIGTSGPRGTVASVDSELTLLYRKLLGQDVVAAGRVENPVYLGSTPPADARRFTRHAFDIYLVTRLDGFSAEDALGLVDRATRATTAGRLVLDQRSTFGDRAGDSWLEQAAARANAVSPGRTVLESTRAVARSAEPVIGYYSWGSNDPAHRSRGSGLTFAPGAIGGMFVSTDGRTFVPPPDDWLPGESDRRGGYYGSGSQSIAADLIREGITGVSAHVEEPYLDATIRPQILFPLYLSGFNLAESFYFAMPYLSWQTIVIGDPLAAPFSARRLTDAEIHKGIDETTGLPALFTERRLAALAPTGLDRQALTLLLRADSREAAGDRQGATDLLVQAADLEPRLTTANYRLAMAYEAAGAHELARERYQRILKVEPDHVVALNNLAYSLATHAHAPAEALPLAERAYRIAPSPTIADTLGWIHHLLGNQAAALPLIERAAAALSTDVDVLIHAAVVRHAVGDAAGVQQALEAALKLDPKVAERPEVKTLGPLSSPAAARP